MDLLITFFFYRTLAAGLGPLVRVWFWTDSTILYMQCNPLSLPVPRRRGSESESESSCGDAEQGEGGRKVAAVVRPRGVIPSGSRRQAAGALFSPSSCSSLVLLSLLALLLALSLVPRLGAGFGWPARRLPRSPAVWVSGGGGGGHGFRFPSVLFAQN